jgi:hypothetical protein
MSSISNANLLIAAQLYGGHAPAAKARRETGAQDFAVELEARPREKGARPANPTLTPPKTPEPMAPAKRFDEGAGRKDPLPTRAPQAAAAEQQSARHTRPGATLNILV